MPHITKGEEMKVKDKKPEQVDPALCEKCGFKGTPLCTHPDGYYHDEPAGLNQLLDSGKWPPRDEEDK